MRIYSLSGGETLAEVPVEALTWVQIEPDGTAVDPPQVENVLRITTKVPGDFSRYALHLEDQRIDRFFNDIPFTFKANCKSYLDCKQETVLDDNLEWVDFPVDYQARDFWSFRRALLDFAGQRYPDWQDRLEADAGVMFAEVLSALADEMAYYQDRVGREAFLETATQRRSLRGHARLVDYDIHDGVGAVSWLDVTVTPDQSGYLQAGAKVSDQDGSVMYEVGHNLAEALRVDDVTQLPDPVKYPVHEFCNDFVPYLDGKNSTLPAGSTSLYLQGARSANIKTDDKTGDTPGKWMLLKENPSNPAERIRAWMVRVILVGKDEMDPVFQDEMVRIDWEPAQALPFPMDLTKLVVRGNLVPISTGATSTGRFSIPQQPSQKPEPSLPVKALEREGANGSVAYRFSLPKSDRQNLVWLGDDPRSALPEINLCELKWNGKDWERKRDAKAWTCRRTLVGVNSSQGTDTHYVLEDGYWQRVVGYHRMGNPEEIVHEDYAQDRGWTVRFGDNEFGKVPPPGTAFEVQYRLGNGQADNVLAETLCRLEKSKVPGQATLGGDTAERSYDFVRQVANPFDITANQDPEPPEQIRQFAPEDFRAKTYRAVRPEDYAEAAERLDWVQRAGGAFRYTGSWLTAFVTPDPKASYQITPAQRTGLEAQLERFRQAGREACAMDPVYATLDLIITLCVEPSSYPGEVEKRVLNALLGTGGARAQAGFFSPDNFSFGTPLYRSLLEKTMQDVPGVRTVLRIQFRRRGWFEMRDFTELVYRVGDQEVIRVENDRLLPERGSLKLEMKGGA